MSSHDALRTRFRRSEQGWEAQVAEDDEHETLRVIDLRRQSDLEQNESLARVANELHGSLRLDVGPSVQAAYFDRGTNRPAWLLAVAHHLVVDAVSWRILFDELVVRLEAADAGLTAEAPPMSFALWAHKLARWADTGAPEVAAAAWLKLPWGALTPIPCRHGPPSGLERATRQHTTSLTIAETRFLTREALERHWTTVADVLVAAAALSVAEWSHGSSVAFDLEGHGREDVVGRDPSRIVGWFTSLYPIVVEVTGDLEGSLRAVMDRLRTLPPLGIHYGITRFLAKGPVSEELRRLPSPEISFNYLGNVEAPSNAMGFQYIADVPGLARSPDARRTHLLEIDAAIVDGALRVTWSYDSDAHRAETIETLGNAFASYVRTLANHCHTTTVPLFTAQTFPRRSLHRRRNSFRRPRSGGTSCTSRTYTRSRRRRKAFFSIR